MLTLSCKQSIHVSRSSLDAAASGANPFKRGPSVTSVTEESANIARPKRSNFFDLKKKDSDRELFFKDIIQVLSIRINTHDRSLLINIHR